MPSTRKRKHTDNRDANVEESNKDISDRETKRTERKASVQTEFVNPTIDANTATDTTIDAGAITRQKESHIGTQGTTVLSPGATEVQKSEIINKASLSNIKVVKQAEMFVKSPDDCNNCSVTGIDVLTDDRIIIADGSNRNIKLFDKERHFLSAYTWPWSTGVGYGPYGVAVSQDDEIYVVFWKSIKVMNIKENRFSEKRTFFFHGNYIKCITAHEGCIFILTATDLFHTARQYVLKIDDAGHSLWAVPVKNDSCACGPPFRNFFEPTVGGNGFCLSSFEHGGKLNVLLSGMKKGKLDGGTGTKLAIEDVDFTGPVCYGNGLMYVSDCCNQIFALIPNTNEKVLLIKLPNTPYTVSHLGTRRRPRPPTFQINCMKFNPRNNQLLVSYGVHNPTPNNIECFQVRTETEIILEEIDSTNK